MCKSCVNVRKTLAFTLVLCYDSKVAKNTHKDACEGAKARMRDGLAGI